MSYPDIMRHTADAWEEVSLRTFQAAWQVCGYFDAEHFKAVPDLEVEVVTSKEEASHLLEPAGVLEGTTIIATPQYCQTYDWRIQD